jgi:hypothetical protein
LAPLCFSSCWLTSSVQSQIHFAKQQPPTPVFCGADHSDFSAVRRADVRSPRNLLKLLVERRLGVIGSKFRTRMVVGALLLSSVPVIVMFLFSTG